MFHHAFDEIAHSHEHGARHIAPSASQLVHGLIVASHLGISHFPIMVMVSPQIFGLVVDGCTAGKYNARGRDVLLADIFIHITHYAPYTDVGVVSWTVTAMVS